MATKTIRTGSIDTEADGDKINGSIGINGNGVYDA